MKVRVIGSSGTFPTATNPASGYLVESNGTRVWCDAGPGTFVSLPVDGALVDAVVISHRHPDHCTDVLTAYHAWTFRPDPREGVPLYANADVLDHLAAFMGKTRSGAFDGTFDLREAKGGMSVSIGGIDLTFVDMNHSVPALGSRWVGDGRSLFFTGDTGPGEWESQVDGADLFLCEAALPDRRTAAEILHLTPEEAGQIARDSGVGTLALTHIPPYLEVAESVARAESVFDRPVRAAVPGTTIKV